MAARWTKADVDAAQSRISAAVHKETLGVLVLGCCMGCGRKVGEAHLPSCVEVAAQLEIASKRLKYGNEPKKQDGYEFASKAELRRYNQLLRMREAGVITDLHVHPEYALHVVSPSGQTHRIGCYVADFAYLRDGRRVVEDVKSRITRTPFYRWKKHHLWAEYGYEVQEIQGRHR